MEQEVEVERAEVEKIGDDAPHFSLADQWPAVEQSDRRDRVQLAEGLYLEGPKSAEGQRGQTKQNYQAWSRLVCAALQR